MTMTAAEFGEWFEIWKWAPWEAIPGPQQEQEIDPMDWVTHEQGRHG